MSEPTPPTVLVGWVDPEALAISAPWAEAMDADDLDDVLWAAYGQCVEFLNGRVPEALSSARAAQLRLAQTMQARALVRATSTGADGSQGMDGMSVTVFPMDWTVKALLRPKKGRRGPR